MAKRKPSVSRKTAASGSALIGVTLAEVLEPLLWLLEAIGVPRREVLATVRALPPVKLPAPVTVVRGGVAYLSRPLIRWAADPRFLGPDGRPRDLSFVAGDPSFSDLVALALPRERPAMCRDILLAAGAIIRLPSGQLRWRERAVLATGAESGVIPADEYLRPLRALLLALQTNLLRRARGVPEGAFQRAVSGFEISPEDMAELQGFVARHGTALLETVDDWLRHRQKGPQRSGRIRQGSVRPYFGLYLSTDSDNAKFSPGDSRSRPHPLPRIKRRRKAPRP
jgi:Family of unknown function (DUF6502)